MARFSKSSRVGRTASRPFFVGATTANANALAKGKVESKMKQQSDGRVVARKRAIIGRSQPGSASIKPLGVVFVSAKAPFMGVVNRAIKVLDRGPGGARWSSTKALPLAERIAKAQDAVGVRNGEGKTARQREVLLLASGHAIGSRLVPVAAWFQRQPGYVVTVRTRWSSTIDELFVFEGQGDSGDDEEAGSRDEDEARGANEAAAADTVGATAGQGMDLNDAGPGAPQERLARRTTRLRNVSVLEVAVRLK